MTAQQIDPMDVLMGGSGAPTAKFEQPGTTIGGRIVAPPRSHQEREYDRNNPGKGALKTFPSGDPIMGITIDVQTDQRDPSNPDDDGVRRIYVEGKRLKEAVRNAVVASGSPKLEVGGILQVTFTGLGVAENSTINAPKEWSAVYTPLAQAQFLEQGQQQQQQQEAPPAQPVQQTAPTQQYAQQQPVQAPQQPPFVQTPQGLVDTSTGQIVQQQPVPVAPPAPPAQQLATQGPTPEAIAALRAAGVDPASVFPGYTGQA